MKKPVTRFQSISLEGKASSGFVPPANIDPITHKSLLEAFQSNLVRCSPAHTWPGNAYLSASPHPILVTDKHQRQLAELSDALFLAISDIVERWWIDVEARFPERMPVEPKEEKLLRCISNVRPFKTCSGSWRPDFLVEPSQTDPDGIENFRICEINARFCWNGFIFTAWGQQSLLDMGVGLNGLQGATKPQKVMDGLGHLYNPGLPLHLVKGYEYGFDIHLFMYYAEQYLGIRPRIIHPDDLRLVPSESPSGSKLCCLANNTTGPTFVNASGETLEEVHQIGLELHQGELMSLSFEMLQEIGRRCFNDLRTILLVHDKRMLGIVLEELDSLVVRKVLTPDQASILDRGIVPTIIPGSAKLDHFITQCRKSPNLKHNYILKPVRGGKGAGILFGDLMTRTKWKSKLQLMRSPQLTADTTYVVQRAIKQNTYEVRLRENDGVKEFPLIGTFHMVHGELLGLGLWRSGPGRVCALSQGGAWMCSVMEE